MFTRGSRVPRVEHSPRFLMGSLCAPIRTPSSSGNHNAGHRAGISSIRLAKGLSCSCELLTGATPRTTVAMSPWLELLLNVTAFAGFLAVATYHRPAKKRRAIRLITSRLLHVRYKGISCPRPTLSGGGASGRGCLAAGNRSPADASP